eukprot:gene397-501_t
MTSINATSLTQQQQQLLENYRGLLQEFCQKRQQPVPSYNTILIDNSNQHSPTYRTEVSVNFKNRLIIEVGTGKSKKESEKSAAYNAFKQIFLQFPSEVLIDNEPKSLGIFMLPKLDHNPNLEDMYLYEQRKFLVDNFSNYFNFNSNTVIHNVPSTTSSISPTTTPTSLPPSLSKVIQAAAIVTNNNPNNITNMVKNQVTIPIDSMSKNLNGLNYLGNPTNLDHLNRDTITSGSSFSFHQNYNGNSHMGTGMSNTTSNNSSGSGIGIGGINKMTIPPNLDTSNLSEQHLQLLNYQSTAISHLKSEVELLKRTIESIKQKLLDQERFSKSLVESNQRLEKDLQLFKDRFGEIVLKKQKKNDPTSAVGSSGETGDIVNSSPPSSSAGGVVKGDTNMTIIDLGDLKINPITNPLDMPQLFMDIKLADLSPIIPESVDFYQYSVLLSHGFKPTKFHHLDNHYLFSGFILYSPIVFPSKPVIHIQNVMGDHFGISIVEDKYISISRSDFQKLLTFHNVFYTKILSQEYMEFHDHNQLFFIPDVKCLSSPTQSLYQSLLNLLETDSISALADDSMSSMSEHDIQEYLNKTFINKVLLTIYGDFNVCRSIDHTKYVSYEEGPPTNPYSKSLLTKKIDNGEESNVGIDGQQQQHQQQEDGSETDQDTNISGGTLRSTIIKPTSTSKSNYNIVHHRLPAPPPDKLLLLSKSKSKNKSVPPQYTIIDRPIKRNVNIRYPPLLCSHTSATRGEGYWQLKSLIYYNEAGYLEDPKHWKNHQDEEESIQFETFLKKSKWFEKDPLQVKIMGITSEIHTLAKISIMAFYSELQFTNKLEEFKRNIISINNHRLLREVFTHPSTKHKNNTITPAEMNIFKNYKPYNGDNQRLEYLGDSVLKFVTGLYLFFKYPNAREGELSSERSKYTNNTYLLAVSKNIGLDELLRLATSEDTKKPLADVLEALFGAVYLELGIEKAYLFIIRIIFNEMADSIPSYKCSHVENLIKPHLRSFLFTIPMSINRACLLQEAFCLSGESSKSYQRLEYLGDACLDLIVSNFLYHTFTDQQEGFLSEKRSLLVKNENLCKISMNIGIPEAVQEKRESLTAKKWGDLFESFVGCILLDQGFEIARDFVSKSLNLTEQNVMEMGNSVIPQPIVTPTFTIAQTTTTNQ